MNPRLAGLSETPASPLTTMFSQRTNWRLTPNALTRAIEEARASGRKILDLTISNPTEAGIRPDAEIVLAALANPEAMHYDPQPRGLLEARQAVCRYYRESHDVFDLDPEHLILTTSTSEAYSYVFRLLCNAGDEILVPKPSYPLFEFLADLADVKLVPYPLLYDHGWQIDFDSLYKAATPESRAVILVHPNNPTGSYVSAAETSALNTFCCDHGLALIVDEVFLDYAHDGTRRRQFCHECRCADLYSQRSLQDLRSAADEACLGSHQRSERRGRRSRSAPRNHRRYLSLTERARPAWPPRCCSISGSRSSP